MSTAYRTDDLKYSKVYLSLKTFKSFIEHSWFFTLLSLSVQQWPMILGTPSHITSVNVPCEGFICFPISWFSIDRTRRQKKSTPRFVNAANFSQTVILFKGIRRKMDYFACILYNTLQMLNYFRRHWADCFSTPGIIYRARFEDGFLVLFCFVFK